MATRSLVKVKKTIRSKVDLTIITPCFNEVLTVEECATSVREIMKQKLPKVSYEHIFVDNASTDGTVSVLREVSRKDSRVKVIVNSRNIGPFRNMYSAMKLSSGNAVIPMLPADLQDPAEVIPELYLEWNKGYMVVYGERVNRQEFILMRVVRALYYRIINLLSESNIPLNVGEFMIIDKRISDRICELNDHYPYIRGLVAQSTSNISFVQYTWKRRKRGKSKSNLIRLIDQAINGLVSTSRAPARLALLTGFLTSTIGILLGIWSLIVNLVYGTQTYDGIPTIAVTLFILGGVQLFFLGLIGEYVLSIHSQVRQLPKEFITEQINFK